MDFVIFEKSIFCLNEINIKKKSCSLFQAMKINNLKDITGNIPSYEW